jgi:hypothetical protein
MILKSFPLNVPVGQKNQKKLAINVNAKNNGLIIYLLNLSIFAKIINTNKYLVCKIFSNMEGEMEKLSNLVAIL